MSLQGVLQDWVRGVWIGVGRNVGITGIVTGMEIIEIGGAYCRWSGIVGFRDPRVS